MLRRHHCLPRIKRSKLWKTKLPTKAEARRRQHLLLMNKNLPNSLPLLIPGSSSKLESMKCWWVLFKMIKAWVFEGFAWFALLYAFRNWTLVCKGFVTLCLIRGKDFEDVIGVNGFSLKRFKLWAFRALHDLMYSIGIIWRWHSEGPFKPLHLMNPTRLAFIRSTLCRHFRCKLLMYTFCFLLLCCILLCWINSVFFSVRIRVLLGLLKGWDLLM